MHRAGCPAGRCAADESDRYRPGKAVIITALLGAAAALLSLPGDPVPGEEAALAGRFCGLCADRDEGRQWSFLRLADPAAIPRRTSATGQQRRSLFGLASINRGDTMCPDWAACNVQASGGRVSHLRLADRDGAQRGSTTGSLLMCQWQTRLLSLLRQQEYGGRSVGRRRRDSHGRVRH